ncbi:tape measure protein [Falcatimonas sp. MSJ-15]|uniref:tape measure protein n=1 Tax=Falcatimonas sp. MSJ-15 TaxID=2841515 RepID=UPI001C123DAA|nr:tape measure protein [Falcatimonas sp. MSJ-15]MBU5470628.1 tape measure protein [Falcatimonas sp. MSJ-15]
MSSIQTGIVLQDNFSNVAQGVVESMYNMTAAAYEASQAVSSNVDTSSIQAATEEINQATAAMDELSAAASRPTAPSVAQPVVDGGNGQVINVDVNPVLPDPLVENPEPLTLDIQPNAPPTGEIGQRIENIRNQLNDVLSMQQQIDQTAATVDVLPDEVTNRMSRVNALIEQIQANLAFSVENPFGLGGNEIEQQLSAIERSLNQAVTQQNMLNNAVGNTERYIRDNVDEQGRFNQEISAGTQQANELTNTIKRAVAAYVSIQSVGKALDISDELASTTARLNLMNDNLQSTEELTNMVYAAAQNSRGSFSDMAANVAKIGNLAGDAFSSSEQIVVFAEQLNKQMKLSGASTQEASAAMLQLTQSLAKGCLNGDELTSVMENGSAVTKTIAEYMGITQGELKDLAAEGQVTSDIIIAAMLGAADQTNAAFETLPMTWADVWQSMKNSALVAFRPVLQRINDLANSQAVQTFVNGAIEAMAVLANIVLNIFELVGTVGGFIADNWSVISPIIYGVIGALAVYAAYLGIVKAIELASAAASMIHSLAMSAKIAVMAAVTGQTMAATAAQMGYNGALYACPVVWIIMLLIALIAIIFAVCNAIAKMTGVANSGFGVIMGCIFTVGALFKNLGLTVANIALGIGNAIAALASNMMTAFHNAICNVQSWFYNLLSTACSVIENIAAALNKLPFVSFDYSGISSAADDYAAKASEAAGNKEDYTSISDAFNEGFTTFDAFQDGWASDAFNAGAAWGDGVADKVSNFSLSDLFGKTEVPDPASYADGFNDVIANSGIGDGVGSIDDNTGKIKDSLEVSEEELKYLRDIAEQEAINRFTTAEVTINQTNNNNVSSDTDIDGFITALDDAMGEAIDSITEGAR